MNSTYIIWLVVTDRFEYSPHYSTTNYAPVYRSYIYIYIYWSYELLSCCVIAGSITHCVKEIQKFKFCHNLFTHPNVSLNSYGFLSYVKVVLLALFHALNEDQSIQPWKGTKKHNKSIIKVLHASYSLFSMHSHYICSQGMFMWVTCQNSPLHIHFNCMEKREQNII